MLHSSNITVQFNHSKLSRNCRYKWNGLSWVMREWSSWIQIKYSFLISLLKELQQAGAFNYKTDSEILSLDTMAKGSACLQVFPPQKRFRWMCWITVDSKLKMDRERRSPLRNLPPTSRSNLLDDSTVNQFVYHKKNKIAITFMLLYQNQELFIALPRDKPNWLIYLVVSRKQQADFLR